MSVDTEGSELDILKGLDFSRFSFSALAIEHNYDDNKLREISSLLLEHGYVRIFKNISKFDAWFINKNNYLAKQ